MNNSRINVKRPVILTLALVALLGITLPIYSSSARRTKPAACPPAAARSATEVRADYPQNQPAASVRLQKRSGSNCPRDPFCCVCGCC
jgi:hypothetical protein